MIKTDLEKIYNHFVIAEDVDDESREGNREDYNDLVKRVSTNKLVVSWKQHDFTKVFNAFIKNEYVNASVQLASNEKLSQNERDELFNRKKTLRMILSFSSRDPVEEMNVIKKEVENYISRI